MPSRYKYCIVPLCANSTFKTPDKCFFDVPRKLDIREKWCKVMKRDFEKSTVLSKTSVRHVCEDHFNLEGDVCNYMQCKLQGGKMRLKKDVIPHKFECQRQDQKNIIRKIEQNKRQDLKSKLKDIETAISSLKDVLITKIFIQEKGEVSGSHKFIKTGVQSAETFLEMF
ncbi:THAP-type domain-containing protein [Nephila pilipes]|uniref:THAP-type domain-containing protein n=1 Tax=Nephila pilipes TaxID=299642 RepID=A0A8X6TPV4_NEPPI|nr:THAP-type domain-containing protein [Nephila pilipes]